MLLTPTSSWTTDLTWTLITAIESDEKVRDSRFPGVGAIKLSGGKPKTYHYWNLALTCFATHELYKDAIAKATDPTLPKIRRNHLNKLWTEKIKNKVKTCVAQSLDKEFKSS